jgi:hypothetical protein
MSSDFKPLPQGEAGYDILRASPVIPVRYRSHDAADTGIRFAMEPRNRTTTDDLLNELRDAIDELISASEGNGEDLVRTLDEYFAMPRQVFANLLEAQPIVGLVVAALILAAEDLGALEMSGETCVCALADPHATSHQPTLH